MASLISERGALFAGRARRWLPIGVAVLVATTGQLAGLRAALAEPITPDAATRAAARAKLVEGVAALKRRQHQAALEKFEEGYALVPSPKIHYNFAQAYLGLGRLNEALTAFERFLAEAPDAPADKRDKAARQVTALRARLGAVAPPAPVGQPSAGPAAPVPAAPATAAPVAPPSAGPAPSAPAAASVPPAVPVPAAAPAPAPSVAPIPAAPAPSVAARPGPNMHLRRIVAISSGAAGAGLLVASVAFGLLARRESDSLTRDSKQGEQGPPPLFDVDKESRGIFFERAQIVTLALGGIAVGVGAVLYATSRERVTLEPTVARSGAGANLKLVF